MQRLKRKFNDGRHNSEDSVLHSCNLSYDSAHWNEGEIKMETTKSFCSTSLVCVSDEINIFLSLHPELEIKQILDYSRQRHFNILVIFTSEPEI